MLLGQRLREIREANHISQTYKDEGYSEKCGYAEKSVVYLSVSCICGRGIDIQRHLYDRPVPG